MEKKGKSKNKKKRKIKIKKETVIVIAFVMIVFGSIPLMMSFKNEIMLEQNVRLFYLDEYIWKYENYQGGNNIHIEIEVLEEEELFFGIASEEVYQSWVQEKIMSSTDFYVWETIDLKYNNTFGFREKGVFYFYFQSFVLSGFVQAEIKIQIDRVWIDYCTGLIPFGMVFVGTVILEYPNITSRFSDKKRHKRMIIATYKLDQDVVKVSTTDLSEEKLLMFKEVIDKEMKMKKWIKEGCKGYGEDVEIMALLSERSREQTRFRITRLEKKKFDSLVIKIYRELKKREIN